jgi:hypothetical protein
MLITYLRIFLIGGYIAQLDSYTNHRTVYGTGLKTRTTYNDFHRSEPDIFNQRLKDTSSLLLSTKNNEGFHFHFTSLVKTCD